MHRSERGRTQHRVGHPRDQPGHLQPVPRNAAVRWQQRWALQRERHHRGQRGDLLAWEYLHLREATGSRAVKAPVARSHRSAWGAGLRWKEIRGRDEISSGSKDHYLPAGETVPNGPNRNTPIASHLLLLPFSNVEFARGKAVGIAASCSPRALGLHPRRVPYPEVEDGKAVWSRCTAARLRILPGVRF